MLVIMHTGVQKVKNGNNVSSDISKTCLKILQNFSLVLYKIVLKLAQYRTLYANYYSFIIESPKRLFDLTYRL